MDNLGPFLAYFDLFRAVLSHLGPVRPGFCVCALVGMGFVPGSEGPNLGENDLFDSGLRPFGRPFWAVWGPLRPVLSPFRPIGPFPAQFPPGHGTTKESNTGPKPVGNDLSKVAPHPLGG